MRWTACIVLIALFGVTAQSQGPPPRPSADTLTCRQRAVGAVNTLAAAINGGQTELLEQAMARPFGVVTFGRNGWHEPFMRANNLRALTAYVLAEHRRGVHIGGVKLFQTTWFYRPARLGFGARFGRQVSRTARREAWLAKGEYACGNGLTVFNASPHYDNDVNPPL